MARTRTHPACPLHAPCMPLPAPCLPPACTAACTAACTLHDVQAAVELSGQKRKPGVPGGGRSKRMQLGNSQLTKLWNMGSNSLEDIAANAAKNGVPSLADYLKPVRE